MKTALEKLFDAYLQKCCIDITTTPIETIDMIRQAFYGGITNFMNLQMEIADEFNDATCVNIMLNIQNELNAFWVDKLNKAQTS